MNSRSCVLGPLAAGCVLAFAVTACSETQPTSEPAPARPAAPTGAASTGAAAAKAKATADESAPAVCTVESTKMWGKHANPRTGLTATRLEDGRLALGVAFGDRPHALVFDRTGAAKLQRLDVAPGSALAKSVSPAQGVRHLQRVTVSAGMKAFADYRDKYKSPRRRIACGPVDAAPLLLFDGEPLIDTEESQREATDSPAATGTGSPGRPPAKPTALATAAAAPSGQATASPAAPGATVKPPSPRPAATRKVPPLVSSSAAALHQELRDCRTFVDPAGQDIWAVGSELVGEEQADGNVQWTMRFFAAPDQARQRVPLHSVVLAAEPKRLHTFEAPVAHRLSDGSYVLATRYRGRMLAWVLTADKRKKGSLHSYGGGYPSLPRIIADGSDHLLLTSQQVDLSHWKLRAIRIEARQSELLDSLLKPEIGDSDASVAEPTFARVGAQRWLAYHAGDRRRGRVMVVPVDGNITAVGRSFAVTADDQPVYESHLFDLDQGQLLIVYIVRPGQGAPELVSKVLRCEVRPT